MSDRSRWVSQFDASPGFSFTWILTVALLAGALYPAAVAFGYSHLGNGNADWVHHLFARKEAALHLAGDAPRVLTVGGSGCLFSVDAEVLERELRQPVVNLCSHAGVGLEYMLARARRHARTGDTVLLVPEFRVLANPDPRQTRLEWDYFTNWDRRHYLEHGLPGAYQLLYSIPFADLWKSREGWRQLREGYVGKLEAIYDVMLLTPNGDLHESLGHREPLIGSVAASFEPQAELARQLVTSFADWARGHGVRVVASYPPLAVDNSAYGLSTTYLANLPGWWRAAGVETVGDPREVRWPPAGFMDTLNHAGAGVAYAHTIRLARHLRGGLFPARVWLIVPPHPEQRQLPFPARAGAEGRVYFGDEKFDAELREFLRGGGHAFAATAELGVRLQEKGFTVAAVAETAHTPASVLAANRQLWIAMCVRPDAPAIPGLESRASGQAWAGLWRDGRWESTAGPEQAEWKRDLSQPLASGEAISYQFALSASRGACAMQFQKRDRLPQANAVARLLVIDPARGILRGIYNFDATLRDTSGWLGAVTAP
jgi:hypothetical protein